MPVKAGVILLRRLCGMASRSGDAAHRGKAEFNHRDIGWLVTRSHAPFHVRSRSFVVCVIHNVLLDGSWGTTLLRYPRYPHHPRLVASNDGLPDKGSRQSGERMERAVCTSHKCP